MRIGLLGGSSFLGEHLLRALAREGHQVVAFSRQGGRPCQEHVTWLPAETWPELCLDAFVSLAPAWVLPDYLERLASAHVKCVVVLSSTSRFTKQASPDPRERALAQRLVNAEQRLQQWAVEHNTQWAVLRPTLIYGHGKDKSICEIARFIQQVGCTCKPCALVTGNGEAQVCIVTNDVQGIAHRTGAQQPGQAVIMGVVIHHDDSGCTGVKHRLHTCLQ